MPRPLSIRLARYDDLDLVMQLLRNCVAAMRADGIEQWDDVYPNRETLETDIRDSTMHLAMVSGRELAGVIVLNEDQNPEYADVPWTLHSSRVAVVHRVMVAPVCQRGGVARTLMADAEDRARALGYDVLRLDAFTLNPRALRLYESLGYRDAGGVALRKGAFRCFEKRLDGVVAPALTPMRLVWPARKHVDSYVAALERGWSPDNVRGEIAAREELEKIAADPDAFVASMVDTEARGAPITLVDGTKVPRLPGYRRWMWDGEFCGSIGFRWQRGTEALPPYCLGHIGYGVVPWKEGRGYATAALRQVVRDAEAEGLRYVVINTLPDNVASRRVIETNGGVLVEEVVTPAAHGAKPHLRYEIPIKHEA